MLVVYRAEKIRRLPPESLTAIQNGDITAATFFSKRTAKSFLALIGENDLTGSLKSIKALCLSPSVLECVQTYKWADTYVAAQPDREGMLALVNETCGAARTSKKGAAT